MKVYIRILLLSALLLAGICMGFLSSAQQISTTKAVSPTTEDLPLFLNGERVGTVANTKPLESRLRSFKDKLPNVNAANGSLPNIGRAVLIPDDRMSMIQLGKVWNSIEDSLGFPPPFESMSLWGGSNCERNLTSRAPGDIATFVLSNRPLSPEELAKITTNLHCWIDTRVIASPPSAYSKRLAKSYRVSYTSLEITENESYLLNDRAQNPQHRVSVIANLNHPSLSRRVDTAPVKRRPIEAGSLEKEVNSWIERRIAEGSQDLWRISDADQSRDILPIVVNAKASYASLGSVLRLVPARNVGLTIVVENPVRP